MVANLLTWARLFLAAIFASGVFILADSAHLSWGVWLLIVVAILSELTDMFDGMAARRLGTASVIGGIFDPLVDSLARLTMYFALALAGWAPIAVPLVMALRDIVVAYTRIVQAMTGGSTSARISGKAKAIAQAAGLFVLLGLVVFRNIFPAEVITALRIITAAAIIVATLWSLFDYLRGAWPGFRQLQQQQKTAPPPQQ